MNLKNNISTLSSQTSPCQLVPQHLSLAGQHSSEWFELSCGASIDVQYLIFNNTVIVFIVFSISFTNQNIWHIHEMFISNNHRIMHSNQLWY
jgi:hypothetical protein